MLCQRCGNKEAAVPVLKVHNGMKQIEYICKDCASQMAGSNLFLNMSNPLQMMSNILGNVGLPGTDVQRYELECPSCGTTFREFSQRGRFGCGDCYEAFRERLVPILEEMHFSREYRGKMPQSPGLLAGEDKLAMLNREKQEAVAREDYERAAELQRQIRQLKKQGEKGGASDE